MKLSPLMPGAPRAANPNEGLSASAERLAKAKAVAAGQPAPEVAAEPVSSGDKQVDRIKKIRLKTQQSTNRHEVAPQVPAEAVAEPATTDKVEPTEQAEPVSEETKPLSPQFAALAKQKRALQLKEQELLAKEKALTERGDSNKSLEEYKARIKANALSVLQEEGVTYDQLTEQILADGQGDGKISALEAKIKALEEGFQTQNKTLTEKDAAAEKTALAQIRKDVDAMVSQGDDYEMIREAGYAPKVVELIHRTYKATGEILDNSEAANLIEKELLEESLKFAKIKKVQSQLSPAPVQQQQPAKTAGPNTKIMRTLTNRDGVSSATMSKRERAIAAMEGRLK